MNNFWQNTLRYPRFFVSSLLGSILIIIMPFRSIFKNKKFKILFILSIIFFFVVILNIIAKMVNWQ